MSSRPLPFAIVLTVLCLSWFEPLEVRADPDPIAEFHRKQGEALFHLKNYGEAIGQFQQAYDHSKDAHLLFRIGQSQEEWGKKDDALKTYQQLLQLNPDNQLLADVNARVKALSGAPASSGSGPILVTADPLEQQGDDLFRAGQYADALQKYQAAQALQAQAIRLYKIGLCYEVLHNRDQAMAFYEQGLAAQPPLNVAHRQDAESRLKCLQQHCDAPPKRPAWRIGVGAGAIGVGGLLTGFGIGALAVNGQIIDSGSSQPRVYQTLGVGTGLLIPGLVLMVGGAVFIALPESLFQKLSHKERAPKAKEL